MVTVGVTIKVNSEESGVERLDGRPVWCEPDRKYLFERGGSV